MGDKRRAAKEKKANAGPNTGRETHHNVPPRTGGKEGGYSSRVQPLRGARLPQGRPRGEIKEHKDRKISSVSTEMETSEENHKVKNGGVEVCRRGVRTKQKGLGKRSLQGILTKVGITPPRDNDPGEDAG